MCFATVADCDRCQGLSCRGIDVCPDAQRMGMIHITVSASASESDRSTDDGVPIDAFAYDKIYFIKIFTVMNQRRIQVHDCGLCDGRTAVENYRGCHDRGCVATHEKCGSCGVSVKHGPMGLCEVADRGLIHIRSDVYEKLHAGRVKVPVYPEQTPGKSGLWALVYAVMEEDVKVGAPCLGCLHG